MINELEALGCDMESVMERFMNDQVFYRECFCKFVSGGGLEQLGGAISSGDIKEAFMQAHGLKGTLANLGLTPIYGRLSEIVEQLRTGEMGSVPQQYQDLMEEWTHYKVLCSA